SFFFQAGVGIRDRYVTGVQTCALPIYTRVHWAAFREVSKPSSLRPIPTLQLAVPAAIRPSDYLVQMPAAAPAAADVPSESGIPRSEERRVGRDCRCCWRGVRYLRSIS